MNRRDQQIAEINANVNELREDLLLSCRAQIIEAYRKASVIDRLANVIQLTDREPSDFRVLTNSEARRLAHFNDSSYSWDFYCKELGRSIALAEERHVFEELGRVSGRGEPIDATNPTLQAIVESIAELRTAGFTPGVLIAPISLYGPVFKGFKIDWEEGRYVVLADGYRLELFWSSKVAPIDRFVVLDRRAGDWKVKLDPESNERITVAIGRPKSPPGAVTFLAETVVKYEIVDHERLRVIEVVGEPPDEFGLEQATRQ